MFFNKKDISYRLQALGLFLVEKIILLLGLKVASHLFGVILTIIGPFLPPSFLAWQNIKKAIPNTNPLKRFFIVLEMWNNLGRNVAEFVFFSGKRLRDAEKYFCVDEQSRQRILAIKNNSQGVIAFLAHFGNWEIYAQVAQVFSVPFTVFYRNMNNPHAGKIVERYRKAAGFKLIEKRDSGRIKLARALKGGDNVLLFLDQRDDKGIVAPFFNMPAMTSPTLANFVLKYDYKVYSIVAIRRHFWQTKFDIKIEEFEPINTGNTEADTIATTSKMNAVIESWVRAHPEQWFWVHNRWRQAR